MLSVHAPVTFALYHLRRRQIGETVLVPSVLDGESGPARFADGHDRQTLPLLVPEWIYTAEDELAEAVSKRVQHKQLFEDGQSDTLRCARLPMRALGWLDVGGAA